MRGALVRVLCVIVGFSLASPSIELAVSEDQTTPEAGICPYLVSLPASDSLCVAADHLAQHRGYKFVKFHVVRDAESQRLAILGCADSSCSAVPQSLPALHKSSSGLLVSSDEWSCCSPSSILIENGLLSSLHLPAACYRVHCYRPSAGLPAVQTSSFLPWKEGQQLGEQVLDDLGFLEFILFKYERFSSPERTLFIAICSVFFLLSLRGYFTLRRRKLASLPLLSFERTGRSAEEVTQPYEVALNPGEGDSVEFSSWQLPQDLDTFNRKLAELKHRVTKLPFAHAGEAGEREGASVVFLGRNVDEPKLVFRNPRVERTQRANIPVHTQAIRNAVIASLLRDTPGFKAYVPRAVVGAWNHVEGVFQEYVPSAKSVSLQDFRESPGTALDLALVILLLRDTDAHEGNYARDPRRKIALFDLGCALGDRPLPSYDRDCLDNFELLLRLPDLLDVQFEERHVQYLKSIDFERAKDMWKNFRYDSYIVSKTEKRKSDSQKRLRANSSIFPLSANTSPRSIPAFINGLLSPRNRPVPLEVSSNATTATSGWTIGGVVTPGGGSSALGSPKSARSMPTGGEFFLDSEEEEGEEDGRLSSVLDMLRVMEMHARFLLRCAEERKTFLFAAKVMYSGFYDERWGALGGRIEDISALEKELDQLVSGNEAPSDLLYLCMLDASQNEISEQNSPVLVDITVR